MRYILRLGGSLVLPLIIFISSSLADEKIKIVASTLPIQSIVESVVGDLAEVEAVTGRDTDPHTFELTPSKLALLTSADVIVFNGLGLEFWGKSLSPSIKEKIIILSEALPSQQGDMHTWLDPVIVSTQALFLAERLCQKFQTPCPEFEKQAKDFSHALLALDEEIKARVKLWSSKIFVSLHPSWTRLAERYNLVQLGTVRSNDHQMLGTKSMVALLALIKEKDAKAVVVARGEEQSGIVIAKAASLPIVVLDEYNSLNVSLLSLIRFNIERLEAVLK